MPRLSPACVWGPRPSPCLRVGTPPLPRLHVGTWLLERVTFPSGRPLGGSPAEGTRCHGPSYPVSPLSSAGSQGGAKQAAPRGTARPPRPSGWRLGPGGRRRSVLSNLLRPRGLWPPAPPSTGSCRQAYWGGQPFPASGVWDAVLTARNSRKGVRAV